MANIVQQGCYAQFSEMFVRYSILIFAPERFEDAAHYVHNAQGVFKTGVSRTWVYCVRKAKLLNTFQSLERRSVNKFGL